MYVVWIVFMKNVRVLPRTSVALLVTSQLFLQEMIFLQANWVCFRLIHESSKKIPGNVCS